MKTFPRALRRSAIAALLALIALPAARAQITAVTGTITDANGLPYAGGTIKAQLTTPGATLTINNQAQCAGGGFGSAPCQVPIQGTFGPISLTAGGTFFLNLADNSLVRPVATQWIFTVNISPGVAPPVGTGPQTCTATVTISGASQDISSSFSACPALTITATNLPVSGVIFANGSSVITSSPPAGGNGIGWKIVFFGSSYAMGIANGTIALKAAPGSWVSTFSGNPANNGGALPDTASSVSLSASNPLIDFNSDTGISRDSAGVLDIGNGTAGDKSGTINASIVQLVNTTNVSHFDSEGANLDTLFRSNSAGDYWWYSLRKPATGLPDIEFFGGGNAPAAPLFKINGSIQPGKYLTGTNCAVNSASPAACGSSAAGAFVVPTTTTTYTVNTSAVSAGSRVILTPRTYTGDLPGTPTCVVPAITAEPVVSALAAGTSFTIAIASTTGQTCWNYWVVN